MRVTSNAFCRVRDCSRMFVASFAIICLAGSFPPGCHADEFEFRLIRDLLQEYDSRVRPSTNASHPLVVTFGLALSQIIDVDEKNQIITTNCWLNQVWIDPKLTWNPDQYGGLRVMRLPHDAIWRPDILLYNNADVSSYKSSISTNVIVTSNGNVTWLSMVIFKSSCAIDVKYFPFDEQNCSMQFASWTYDGLQLNLVKVGDDGDASNYIQNTEWSLVKLHAQRNVVYYSCCAEPYPDITYTVQIRRKPLFYVFNMILPCFIITLVALLGFYIPSDSGEKVSMGITTLLSMTVFLMLVAENMPPTSDVLPLVGLYYGITIVIVSLATAMTVLTLNIHHKGEEGEPVPRYIKLICFGFLARILCLKIQTPKTAEHNLTLQGLESALQSTDCGNERYCSYIKMGKSRRDSSKYTSKLNDRAPRASTDCCPQSGNHKQQDFLAEDINQRDPNLFDCSSPKNGRHGVGLSRGVGIIGPQQQEHRASSNCGTPGAHVSTTTTETTAFITATQCAMTSVASINPSSPSSTAATVTAVASADVGLMQQQQQLLQGGGSILERRLARTLNKLCQTIDRSDLRLADDDRRHANRIEWQQVSVVVDRLLLVVFTVGTVAITAGILIHAPHSRLFLFGGGGSDVIVSTVSGAASADGIANFSPSAESADSSPAGSSSSAAVAGGVSGIVDRT